MGLFSRKDPGADPEHNMCSRKHNKPDASCASTGGPASVDSCKVDPNMSEMLTDVTSDYLKILKVT